MAHQKKNTFWGSLFCGSALLLPGFSVQAQDPKVQEQTKPNVLFIIVDDLRPQLGCYGNQLALTPHLDQFASEGTLFSRAFCNYPVCGPSRASLFSGIRPGVNRFTGNEANVEKERPDVQTINTYLKNHGYVTAAMGKVFHNRVDNLAGWTDGAWNPAEEDPKRKITGWRDYLTRENQELCKQSDVKAGNAWELADVDDDAYYDGKVAVRAMQFLEKYKKDNSPFLLTLGFVKPHLPFNAPKKYWDLYPEEKIKLPSNFFYPENMPEQARFNYPELRAYNGIPKTGNLPEGLAKQLIRGYYACASYADAQVGRVLDKLKELELDKNTLVILIGDHGWHLGEHTLWAKHSNFFNTLNTTMIVREPGAPAHNRVSKPVELVDIFPTMCDYTGVALPAWLDGNSLMPLLKNPESKWKKEVFSKFENAWSVATDRYLYTEWKDAKGETIASMLYDHRNDAAENKNISGLPKYRKTVAGFHKSVNKIYSGSLKHVQQ